MVSSINDIRKISDTDFRDSIKRTWRAIVPVGSLEQHSEALMGDWVNGDWVIGSSPVILYTQSPIT